MYAFAMTALLGLAETSPSVTEATMLTRERVRDLETEIARREEENDLLAAEAGEHSPFGLEERADPFATPGRQDA